MTEKKWLNEAIVVTSLKVTGRGGDDHTELTTTNSSRIWPATGQLKETLKARAVSAEQLTSISKPYESTTVDYNTIDGEPIHLSTLACLVMPNVSALLTRNIKH